MLTPNMEAKNVQAVTAPPMPIPPTGSANPSASLSALWGYVQPALQHIVRSPTNDGKAPSIDVVYHMGIHTATYNYFTAQSESANSHSSDPEGDNPPISGTDLYQKLDIFYGETAREALLGAPEDDSDLIHYIIPCFNRYSAGAHAVNRLLNYVNRHFVKRATDEGRGWLHLNDVMETVARDIVSGEMRDIIRKRMKEKRMNELKKWGYEDGASAEQMSQAEACAEAASPPECIVMISSLAFRRFRTDFFEPLLAVPKYKGKGKIKNKRPLPSNGDKLGPKGRLARAVKALLESTGGDEEEKKRLATNLANTLRIVGIRADHPLRKKLDKFVSSTT